MAKTYRIISQEELLWNRKCFVFSVNRLQDAADEREMKASVVRLLRLQDFRMN